MQQTTDKTTKLILGDCLKEMKNLKANSIDTIITDPPYGIIFMGKVWDNSHPTKEVWVEALRVAKLGATLLCFGGTRTYHRLACAIEDASWILKDCIMWLYGSGFPKATDISKQLDKGHKRKIVGEKPYTTPKADNSIQANSYGISGGSLKAGQKAERLQEYITEPTTPQAKLWNGWKSHGLKPAYEPILVAMKPNEGSYAENALKHGVSGLNIDGSRITLQEGDKKVGGFGDAKSGYQKGIGNTGDPDYKTEWKENTHGRFPANIILDEEAARLLDEQSGISKSSMVGFKGVGWRHSGNTKDKKTKLEYQKEFNDKGGASRFFYCAKSSKAERNRGCESMNSKDRPGKMMHKANNTSNEPSKGFERFDTKPAHNHHPTVKPLKLMEYLCTLTKTPTGGVVLDPFMGSGTTGMACKTTGRSFIGIEKDPEYFKIAGRRIKCVQGSLL